MAKTYDELIKCAAREVVLRRRVYPKWIASGKLRQSAADHEIECMEAILSELEAIRNEKDERRS